MRPQRPQHSSCPILHFLGFSLAFKWVTKSSTTSAHHQCRRLSSLISSFLCFTIFTLFFSNLWWGTKEKMGIWGRLGWPAVLLPKIRKVKSEDGGGLIYKREYFTFIWLMKSYGFSGIRETNLVLIKWGSSPGGNLGLGWERKLAGLLGWGRIRRL